MDFKWIIIELGLFPMLFALMNGKKVKASKSLPRGQYICPYKDCENPNLVLKKGKIKIAHFAHLRSSECQQASEPETNAHLEMKNCFQETLNLSNEYMEYGKIPGVRPDVIWKKKYAMELQHSPISIAEMQRRNAIYFQNKLIPIWILHGQESHSQFEQGYFCKSYSDFKSFFLQNPSLFDFIHLFRQAHEDNIYYLTLKEKNHSKSVSLAEIFGAEEKPRQIVKLNATELFILQHQGILLYQFFEQDGNPNKYEKNHENSVEFNQQFKWPVYYPIIKFIPEYETLLLLWELVSIQDEREFDAVLKNIWHHYRYTSGKMHFSQKSLDTSEPLIPKEVRNQLLIRAEGACERCYHGLPIKNLVKQQDDTIAVIWEGYKCQKCGNSTLITGWDVRLDRKITDLGPIKLAALTSFYQKRYDSKRQYPDYVNRCTLCKAFLKKKGISNWMIKLKECENSPGYIDKVNEYIGEGKIAGLKLISKHYYYFIGTKGWDLVILCPDCYISSKKPNYQDYHPQQLDFWFDNPNFKTYRKND